MNISINYVGNIDFYRLKLKLTKKQMCELADISLSSYNDMIKRNSFSTITLEKLAKSLNVTVADLVKDRSRDEKQEALKDISEIKKRIDDFEQKHLK